MLVKCEQCGRILNLMDAIGYSTEEGKALHSYYFCSKKHMIAFAKNKGIPLTTIDV